MAGMIAWLTMLHSQLGWLWGLDVSATCRGEEQASDEPGIGPTVVFLLVFVSVGFAIGFVCGRAWRPRQPTREVTREVSTQSQCRYSWYTEKPRFCPVPHGVDGAWPHQLG